MLIQVVPRAVLVMLVVGVMACLSSQYLSAGEVITNDLVCDGSQCQCYVVSVSGGVTRYDSGGRGNTRLVSRVSQQDAGWPHPLVMLCPDFKVIKSTFYICQRGNCIRYD